MPERENLDLLGPITAPEQDQELKDTAEDQVQDRPGNEQRGCPLRGHARAMNLQLNSIDPGFRTPHASCRVRFSKRSSRAFSARNRANSTASAERPLSSVTCSLTVTTVRPWPFGFCQARDALMLAAAAAQRLCGSSIDSA